jgi:multiple sugar transport system permease protein/raffinose/stachyose/melibiose transport system permease protein
MSGIATPAGPLGLARRRGFRREAGRRRRTSWGLVAVFVLPSLLIYLAFMVWPFFGNIELSFQAWDGFGAERTFVGLDNYVALFNDGDFWAALSNNLVWAVIGTAAPIAIGLPLAIMLWSGSRFRLAFRAIYFLPVILPIVVIGLIWGWIYNPLFGVLNTVLDAVGLGELTRGWLGDPSTALYAVLFAAIWATFGLCVVLFLAGLQGIDMNLIDAAKVDGANSWQRTRHVLLPGIAPVMTFVITITLVGAFSVFDIVYVMTRGGPGTATETMAGYAYKVAFSRNFAGYGAAISTVIGLISLVLAVAILRYRESRRA